MPAPKSPTREVSSNLRCDRPQSGGLMSFPCSLLRGHDEAVNNTDPTDPQPCYAVESGRSVRVWQAWAEREFTRQQNLLPADPNTYINCPACGQHSMQIDQSRNMGICGACGDEAEIQQSIDHDTTHVVSDADVIETLAPYIDPESEPPAEAVFQKVVVPAAEPATALHHDLEPFETGERDIDIIAAAQKVALAEGSSLTPDQMDSLTQGQRPEGVPDIPGITTPLMGIAKHAELADTDLTIDPASGDMIEMKRTSDLRTRPEDQVLPDGDESIPDDQSLVIADIEKRRQVGVQRYGQGHRPFNGRNTLQDAYEENLDWLVYMRSLLRTREADKEALIDVVTKALLSLNPDDEQWFERGSDEVAAIAVDRLLDWHIAQRTKSQDGITDRIREALKSGFSIMGADGDKMVSMSYLLGALERIDRQNEAEAQTSGPTLTERLNKIEEILKPLGIINRAVALGIDAIYIDKEND